MESGRAADAALPLRDAAEQADRPERPVWLIAVAVAIRAAYVVAALAIFIFALQVLRAGAGGLKPILTEIDAHGTANIVGFGWLGSYVVLAIRRINDGPAALGLLEPGWSTVRRNCGSSERD